MHCMFTSHLANTLHYDCMNTCIRLPEQGKMAKTAIGGNLMTKPSVAEALRELAKGDKSRSETARLRDVIDDVEAALDAGVSRAAVLEALHGQGFTMALKSFESALYRIRKQREGKSSAAASASRSEPSASLSHDEEAPAPPEPEQMALDTKQHREAKADRYIGNAAGSPLRKSILNKDKK